MSAAPREGRGGAAPAAPGRAGGPDPAGLGPSGDRGALYATHRPAAGLSDVFLRPPAGPARRVCSLPGRVVRLRGLRRGERLAALTDAGELRVCDAASGARVWGAEGVSSFAVPAWDDGVVALLRAGAATGPGGAPGYVLETLRLDAPGEREAAPLGSLRVCACGAGGAGGPGSQGGPEDALRAERSELAFLSRDPQAAVSAAVAVFLVSPGLGLRAWLAFPVPLAEGGGLPRSLSAALPAVARTGPSLRPFWTHSEWVSCVRAALSRPAARGVLVDAAGRFEDAPAAPGGEVVKGSGLLESEELGGPEGPLDLRDSVGSDDAGNGAGEGGEGPAPARGAWLGERLDACLREGAVLLRALPCDSGFVAALPAGSGGGAGRGPGLLASDGRVQLQILSADPERPGGVCFNLTLRNSGLLAVGYILGLCDLFGAPLLPGRPGVPAVPPLAAVASMAVADPGMATACAPGDGTRVEYLSVSVREEDSPANPGNPPSLFFTSVDFRSGRRSRSRLDERLAALAFVVSPSDPAAGGAGTSAGAFSPVGALRVSRDAVLLCVRDRATGECFFLKGVTGGPPAPAQAASADILRMAREPSPERPRAAGPGSEGPDASASQDTFSLAGLPGGPNVGRSPLEALLEELGTERSRADPGLPAAEALAQASRECILRAVAASAALHVVGEGGFASGAELEKAVVGRYLDVLLEEQRLRALAAEILQTGEALAGRARVLRLRYAGATPEALDRLEAALGELQDAAARAEARALGRPGPAPSEAGPAGRAPRAALEGMRLALRRREKRVLELAARALDLLGPGRERAALAARESGTVREFLRRHPEAQAEGRAVRGARVRVGGRDRRLEELLPGREGSGDGRGAGGEPRGDVEVEGDSKGDFKGDGKNDGEDKGEGGLETSWRPLGLGNPLPGSLEGPPGPHAL